MDMDWLLGFIDVKAILIVLLIFGPLERMLPARPQQPALRRAWTTDAVHCVVNRIPIGIGLGLVAALSIWLGDAAVPASFRASVAAQPLWLQTIILMLLADLIFYAMHRLFHTVPALWRIHAIHHSISDLDWLAAYRIHPLDQILTKGASLIPAFALGFSDAALAIFFVVFQWHTLLLHSNVRIGFGPFSWLVASPCFHHWHHANDPAHWNRNFAAQFPLWDILFGTAQMRRDAMPDRYGIEDPVPPGYGRQMVYPFQRESKDAA
ncbi:sterol desaturase family protein [Sphingopyxis sp. 2PD]|uniref:sterol desaturase family protein n=1 Tax=Sphingopyxis sp. 2PD TaxID=2502196 RepID=UPI001BB2AD5C|nr:sterol desaturase family protein [Sphingopyxis sp. 2PD]